MSISEQDILKHRLNWLHRLWGDVVICEAPSYVGALGVFKSFQCEVVHAEMDDDGLVPDALRAAITTAKAAGKRIKFLYTIPNFHNPAGVTLSAARRAEVLETEPAELSDEDHDMTISKSMVNHIV